MAETKVVAVIGASGAVGREICSLLAERHFEIQELRAFCSEKSVGEEIDFGKKSVTAEAFQLERLEGVDMAFFCAGEDVSQRYVPKAVEMGLMVVDTSPAFRNVKEVPLIVPEVNGDVLRDFLARNKERTGLFAASPSPSTIALVVALNPISLQAGLHRVVASTYQSVSDLGRSGMQELWEQSLAVFRQDSLTAKRFPKRIAFNCFPHSDVFNEDGYTKEEQELQSCSERILDVPDLRLSATAVRVPVFSCHCLSLNVETQEHLDASSARELLSKSPGIVVLDAPDEEKYPHPVDVGGSDGVFVGRIRNDATVAHGLNLWIVLDSLRKGAALNAVEIAEIMASI